MESRYLVKEVGVLLGAEALFQGEERRQAMGERAVRRWRRSSMPAEEGLVRERRNGSQQG